MKMKIFRRVAIFVVLAILFSSVLVLGGCVEEVPLEEKSTGKMDELSGTYKLTSYMTQTNLVNDYGIEMFLVISGSRGYYAYKDNSTDAYAADAYVKFAQTAEDKLTYSNVQVNFADGYKVFDISIKKHESETVTELSLNDAGVVFTKVSSNKDLSYVDSYYKDKGYITESLTPMMHGLKKYDGTYIFEKFEINSGFVEVGERPIYQIFDFDFANGKVTYYTRKRDNAVGSKTVRDVTVTKENGFFVLQIDGLLFYDARFVDYSSTGEHYLEYKENLWGAGTLKFKFLGDLNAAQIQQIIDEAVEDYHN